MTSIRQAGFAVPYGMQTWRSFIEDGDLGRTLVRMCLLAERAVPLSFVLERGPALGIKVVFVLRGEPIEIACGPEPLEESAMDGLTLILRGLNAALRARGIDRRFIVDDTDYRLLLLDARGAAWAAARSWLVEKCLEPEPSIETKQPRSARELPRLRTPEQIVPPKRHFREDPSYPALLADYFLRFAAFARVGPVTCEPTPSLAPLFRDRDFFSLRVTWSFRGGGGSVQETVRIKPGARVPLQPICDTLNHGLAMRGNERRRKGPRVTAYLCASSPWGEHVVLATAAEAARLRRHAYLIEPEPVASSIELLGDSGFELPYLGGYWQNWGNLDRCLTRTCLLARERIALTFEIAREDRGATVIRYRAGTDTAAYRYELASGKEEVFEVLPRVYRDLNTFIAAQGIAHRFVMMRAEPHWYTPRLLLLAPSSIASIRNAPGTYLECLPPEPSPLPVPISHPERALAETPDRVPTVAEIVGKQHVLDSDFKCSSRETDYPSLVEEIARFAKVSVRVEPLAVADESVSYYDVRVSHEGAGAVIRLDNEKYAQVGPILDYLNPILATSGNPRALYRFDGGGFEGGVVSATIEESARLREAGYLVEQPLASS